MSILQQTRFFTTADQLHQLPMLGLPEIAFAGRSNAGKSTAINTICLQKRLAFSSKTPGRTQHLNFFAVGTHAEDEELPAAFLVDLPGYGYAQVARDSKAHWEETLSTYIRHRNELRALVLIMDARRPLTDLDLQMIEWFTPTAKPIHALLTKADKLNRNDSTAALLTTKRGLAAYGAQHTVQLFSSLKKVGVEEAQQRVLELLGVSDRSAFGVGKA
jgi:GTP-binding protein